MSEIPPAALGAIVAALIAGLVALITLLINKENSISAFRQVWIDDLRKDIADLLGRLDGVLGTVRVHGSGTAGWNDARGDVVAYSVCFARIRLRLNPTEPHVQDLVGHLADLERALEGVDAQTLLKNRGRIDDIRRRLVADAQVFLKKEWIRVRDGEPVYKWTRRIAAIIVVGLLALLAIVAL